MSEMIGSPAQDGNLRGYIQPAVEEDLKPHPTLRHLLHGVFERSPKKYLSTREVERAVRSNHPAQQITQTNIGTCLSRSPDFILEEFGRGGRRRWTLAGTCGGVNKERGRAVSQEFNRTYTQHTLQNVGPRAALWKKTHAVLNASHKGSLTTKGVEGAIRSHYPTEKVNGRTLSYNLSISKDFKQVYCEGKKEWFLTGLTKGVKRRNTIGATSPCEETGGNGDGGDNVATSVDSPPAAELPYPSKTEEIEAQYSPEPTFSPQLVPASLPATQKIPHLSLPGSGRTGEHSRSPTRYLTRNQTWPPVGKLAMHLPPYFEPQLNPAPSQDMTSAAYPRNPTREELLTGLDELSSSLTAPLPPHPPSEEQLLSDTSSTVTQGNAFVYNPNDIGPYPQSISYQVEPESHEVAASNDIGSFVGATTVVPFTLNESVDQRGFLELLMGEGNDGSGPKPLYSSTATSQQGLPYASEMMAYQTYKGANVTHPDDYNYGQASWDGIPHGQPQTPPVVNATSIPLNVSSFPLEEIASWLDAGY